MKNIPIFLLCMGLFPTKVDIVEIRKQHTARYYGEYRGPETPEGYWDKSNYSSLKLDSVEFLVIHCTEGYEVGDRKVLSGETRRKVSTNFYITKDGAVIQYVPPGYRSWHAGRSLYEHEGRTWLGFNNFSIGVELENRYVEDPKRGSTSYTEAQMEALYSLHKYLQSMFPVLRDPSRTVGHEDISGYRGKKDPGPMFDWMAFRLSVFEDQGPPPYSVMVNGQVLRQPLILVENRSYLPLRAVAEACNLRVSWFSQEKRVELVSLSDESSD